MLMEACSKEIAENDEKERYLHDSRRPEQFLSYEACKALNLLSSIIILGCDYNFNNSGKANNIIGELCHDHLSMAGLQLQVSHLHRESFPQTLATDEVVADVRSIGPYGVFLLAGSGSS